MKKGYFCNVILSFLFAFILHPLTIQAADEANCLVSGKAIKIAGNDSFGPLAYPGIKNSPLGAVYVYGSDRPDIFLFGKHFSTGLKLYKYIKSDVSGVPFFDTHIHIELPFELKSIQTATIFQTKDDAIYSLWIVNNKIIYMQFNNQKLLFEEIARVDTTAFPRMPNSIGTMIDSNDHITVLLGIDDGVSERPKQDFKFDPNYFQYHRDPRYIPYDGAGVWKGGFPYTAMYSIKLSNLLNGDASITQVSPTQRESQQTYGHLTQVNLGKDRCNDIITGSHYGIFYYYHNQDSNALCLETKKYVTSPENIIIRHPSVWAEPIAYPNQKTGVSDLIVGGEGGTYYYKFTEKFNEFGFPIYQGPLEIMEKNADLYGGTLVVPNVVDWDGDGIVDIISGNSHGKILFFKNFGTNLKPRFSKASELYACGQVIHIQAGYGQSVQGPGEARWGYTSPTVYDWNQDGLPDILMSDITAKHTVFLNIGTKINPKLDSGKPLYVEGLELHGTWRCKPAVGMLNGKLVYITLDDDDQIHLYKKIDNYNLEDAGKLHLNDGTPIQATFMKAGGTGRLKMNLVDWDNDGQSDLIIGAAKWSSVPNPKKGLPWNLKNKNKGACVLFLKNVGTDMNTVFEFPKLMHFKEKPAFFGSHECGVAIADFGTSNNKDIIVGDECGRYIYFKNSDISFK